MREVIITPALNGFIVRVGCKTLVFESIAMVCQELSRYQHRPEEVEKEYIEHAINKVGEGPIAEERIGYERPQTEIPGRRPSLRRE